LLRCGIAAARSRAARKEVVLSPLAATAFALAILGLLLGLYCFHRARASAGDAAGGLPSAVFLFHGDRLVDACPSARQRLADLPRDGAVEPALAEAFASFPGIANALSDLLRRGREFDVSAPSGALRGRATGDWRRLELFDSAGAIATRVAEQAPIPIWRETDDGTVTWGNAAWRALGRDRSAADGPLVPPERRGQGPARIAVPRPGVGPDLWLEVTSLPDPPGGWLNYAVDVSAEVGAKRTLRNFVDTLTMTFAHLPIGLAVFDRERRLSLFNPALSDLTRLEPDWLAARPDLFGFLDRLRERHRMPEPKDYRGYRNQLAEMEAAAAQGIYQATWPLASGETFRITGRPHPEGALAFLFEDITGEMTLKRRFRTEIALGHAVMDRLDCAIAVFEPSGSLAFANAAYHSTTGMPAPPESKDATRDEDAAPMGIVEATRIWQDKCEPSPVWGDLRDFAAQTHDRAEWTAEVQLKTGARLSCRFAPLPGGATLCVFSDLPGSG
jgi:PAS domain-containing protein